MQNLNMWKFGTQVFFSLVVMGLCVFKLADNATPSEQRALYWGGLTGILGYWLPSPSNNQDEQQELTIATGRFAVGNQQKGLVEGAIATAKTESQN